MSPFPRAARRLVPALAAVAAAAAIAAPTASAADYPVVTLDETAGVLTYTGDWRANNVTVRKEVSTARPGTYDLKLYLARAIGAGYSSVCDETGVPGAWVVSCPAAKVKQLKFVGGDLPDRFQNDTALPSVAHGAFDDDTFNGGAGPDRFYGDGGSDTLYGNTGNDTLDGGNQQDQVWGGPGMDVASWEDASSPVTLTLNGLADDGIAGEHENIPSDIENLQGGPYDDKLVGDFRPNQLRGGAGPDNLDGAAGDDLVNGQAGDDLLHAEPGADQLYGGTEADTLSYAGAASRVTVLQDFAANDGTAGENDSVNQIEKLTGSPYDDELQGTDGDDTIDGGLGADRITPKNGADKVSGGDGNDLISGGPGASLDSDTVDGGPGEDTIDYSARSDDLVIVLDGSHSSGGSGEYDKLTSLEDAYGGSGTDVIHGSNGSNSLTGGPGADDLEGHGGNDWLNGESGRDLLIGGADDDHFSGGADDDTLSAVGGSDTLWGGDGQDKVLYTNAPGKVVATIGSGTSGPSGEADAIAGDVEQLEGSDFGDWLIGSDASNTLIGHKGADVIVGKGGLDVLKGDEGADALNSDGDGLQDHTSCGADGDQAKADKADLVDGDCETVNRV